MPGQMKTTFPLLSRMVLKQDIILLTVDDLGPIKDRKIETIPRTSERFPTGGPVEEFVDSETKIYALDQLYEFKKQPEGKKHHSWISFSKFCLIF